MRAWVVTLALLGLGFTAADLDPLCEQAGAVETEVKALHAALEGLLRRGGELARCVEGATLFAPCAELPGGDRADASLLHAIAGMQAFVAGDAAGAEGFFTAAIGGPDAIVDAFARSSRAVLAGARGDTGAAVLGTQDAIAAASTGPTEYVAQLHLNLGWFEALSGDLPAATRACEVALSVADAPWLDDQPGTLCRNVVAADRFTAGRYADAERLWTAAWGFIDAHTPPGDPARAVVLGNLGRAAVEGGHPVDGIPRLEAALAAAVAASGERSEPATTYLYYLSDARVRAGDFDAGAAGFRRLAGHYDASYGADSVWAARAQLWLGAAEQRRGRYAAAEAALRQGLRTLERQAPGSLDLASAAGKLSELLCEEGRFGEALPLAARAVALARQAGTESDVAAYLVNEGNALRADGDFAAAKARYEDALAMFETALGPDHAYVASTLTNVAGLAEALGDRDAARPLLERALEIDERVLPPDHPFLATALNNLGTSYWAAGEPDRAYPLLQRAVDIWTRAMGPGHPWTVAGRRNMAQLLISAGRPDEAARALHAAADAAEALLGRGHPAVAGARVHEAEALSWAGDQEGALALYRSVLPLQERALGREHPDLAWPLTDLARIERLVGDEDAARATLDRVARIARDTVLPLLDATSERERQALVRSMRHYADLTLSVFDRPGDAALAYRAMLDWKSAVFGSLRSQRLLLDDAANAGLREELRAVRQELASVAFGDDVPGRDAALPSLQARKEAVERKLARGGGAKTESPDPAALCEALDPTEALVDFLRYSRRPPPRVGDREEPPVESYVAFVLPGGACAAPIRVELGPAAPIDDSLRRFRKGVIREVADDTIARRGAELRTALWEPLLPALSGRTAVRVVPDGDLNSLPFAALPDGDSFLVERFAVSYLGAAADLLTERARPGRGALVVGGVAYERGASARSRSMTRSPPRGGLGPFAVLPGTVAEADAIEDALPGATSLRGEAATEAAFRAGIAGKRVVHLATHGFFVPPAPVDPTGSVAAVTVPPMLRSGLVLAGADEPGRPSDDDGLLTAEEVLALDLRGVELAALSACETGLGDIEAGDGVLGLRRAFALAGARTLLLSLWKVPDDDTRVLMADLYSRLAAGATPADALRKAQIARIEAMRSRGEPASAWRWAAFVASGP